MLKSHSKLKSYTGLKSGSVLKAISRMVSNSALSKKKAIGHSEKRSAEIDNDDEFYKKVWEHREHICEECGIHLGELYIDDKGRVVNRFMFAHILSKGSYPKLRRVEKNVVLLCMKDHDILDHGDKASMKINTILKDTISELYLINMEL